MATEMEAFGSLNSVSCLYQSLLIAVLRTNCGNAGVPSAGGGSKVKSEAMNALGGGRCSSGVGSAADHLATCAAVNGVCRYCVPYLSLR